MARRANRGNNNRPYVRRPPNRRVEAPQRRDEEPQRRGEENNPEARNNREVDVIREAIRQEGIRLRQEVMLNLEDIIRSAVRYELRAEMERPELLQRFRQALDDEIGRLIINDDPPVENPVADIPENPAPGVDPAREDDPQ